MTTYDKTGWSHSCLYLQTFTHFHHLCYISPSVLLWTMLTSYNGKKATQKPLTSVVVGGITGMTREVTQHSIFFSLSYKIKNASQKTKIGKSHNKKRKWWHAKVRRMRGKREVDKSSHFWHQWVTQPSHYSHLLFFQDVCLGLQWLLYISTVPYFLRLISQKSDVLVHIKKEILVLLTRDWISILSIKKLQLTMKKLLFSFLIK